MEQTAFPISTERPKRPLGVWVLTIYDALFAGVFPLVIAISVLVGSEGAISFFILVPTFLIAPGVIIAAVGAWRGNNKARVALVILVTLHYVLVAINNASALITGAVAAEMQGRVIGRIFRGFFWPAINIWYFRRDETLEFYQPRK